MRPQNPSQDPLARRRRPPSPAEGDADEVFAGRMSHASNMGAGRRQLELRLLTVAGKMLTVGGSFSDDARERCIDAQTV
jgi:hypothetical protein